MEDSNQKNPHKVHLKDSLSADKLAYYRDNDSVLWTIQKKAERLTTAIYMITDFYDNRESLKWGLREKCLAVMTLILKELKDINTSSAETILHRTKNSIVEILSLIDIAEKINLISEMNASIIRGEYISLHKMAKESVDSGGLVGSITFPDNFFTFTKDSGIKDTNVIQKDILTDAYKGHNQLNKLGYKGHEVKTLYTGKNIDDIKDKISVNTSNYRNKNKSGYKRREIILQILKTKEEVSIKDITAAISGCSEKTIQRDLMTLIKMGNVKRKGERRWSTYVLTH